MPRTAPHMPGELAKSAFELFGERGFKAVSLNEVAAHRGVTKGSIYSHYRSKRELILAACEYYYKHYEETVHRTLRPVKDPAMRLRKVVELSVRTCVVDDCSRMFTTEVFALSLKDAEVREGWARFYDRVRSMYIDLAQQAWPDLPAPAARRGEDLMHAAIEGIKQRATFERQIADESEQQAMVEELLRVLKQAVEPGRSRAA